jgi:hypothetical protein
MSDRLHAAEMSVMRRVFFRGIEGVVVSFAEARIGHKVMTMLGDKTILVVDLRSYPIQSISKTLQHTLNRVTH